MAMAHYSILQNPITVFGDFKSHKSPSKITEE